VATLIPGERVSGTHWIGGCLDFGKRLYRDSNSDPSVVQPAAKRYADRAAAVPINAAAVSAVGIETGCRLDDRGAGIRVPVG
jgi:hypothetical protein